MGILEVIYNAYCEGEFTVKLPEHTASDNIKITSIEKMFDMSPQQIEEFESRFLEICDDAQRREIGRASCRERVYVLV